MEQQGSNSRDGATAMRGAKDVLSARHVASFAPERKGL
jgi:hypothetical protein